MYQQQIRAYNLRVYWQNSGEIITTGTKGQVRMKTYSLFLQVPFDDINRMGLYEKIRTEE